MRHLLLFALAACDDDPTSTAAPPHAHGDVDFAPLPEPVLTLDEARVQAIKLGAETIIWSGSLPIILSEEEASPTHAFLERTADGLRMTRFDPWTGDLLDLRAALPPNVADFVEQTGVDLASGTTPGTYDNFPWGWRLPFDTTSQAVMTCGYGCRYHTGTDQHATDWDPGNAGHALESPASCFVLSNSYHSSYGWQVIAECGDAGGGKRWLYRAAHMRSQPVVTPGWWIWKDRYIGPMGRTGTATGDHIHFVAYHGTYSAGRISGSSLPISRWPSVNDSLCNGAFRTRNFSGSAFQYLGAIRTNGCP